MRACAKVAMYLSFEGMETYSSLEYCYDKTYLTVAEVAWNSSTIDDMEEFNERYAYRKKMLKKSTGYDKIVLGINLGDLL